MTKKKAYVVNHTKKIITIDDTVNQTIADKEDILYYAQAGYIKKHKSQVRARQAKQRAIDNGILTAQQIRDALANDQDALAMFEEKCKNGFFSGVKFYREWLGNHPKKRSKLSAPKDEMDK